MGVLGSEGFHPSPVQLRVGLSRLEKTDRGHQVQPVALRAGVGGKTSNLARLQTWLFSEILNLVSNSLKVSLKVLLPKFCIFSCATGLRYHGHMAYVSSLFQPRDICDRVGYKGYLFCSTRLSSFLTTAEERRAVSRMHLQPLWEPTGLRTCPVTRFQAASGGSSESALHPL